MSRTLPSTVTTAIAAAATRPIYLIQLGFDTVTRIATWDSAITWGGYTWSASGASIRTLNSRGTTVELPNGNTDPWLATILSEGTRERPIAIYEHHTNAAASPQSDAVLVFLGIMDESDITDDKISVKCIESSMGKYFPPTPVTEDVFTHLMTSGDRIVWGNDIVTVN